MREGNIKGLFLKDFTWYFLGSLIPILIGIVKTPIFTRHFSQADFGYLGIVTVSFSFLSMVLFSWIGSCIWRFYPKYKTMNKLSFLYTNLFILFLSAFIILLIIVGTWFLLEKNLLVKKLIAYSFIHLIFNQLYLFYIIVVRLEGKSFFYSFVQSTRAIVSFLLTLILIFIFEVNIVSLILSLLVIDFFSVLFLTILNPSKVLINLKKFNKQCLKEISTYGTAGLLINVCFLVISLSDRYIIAWFGTINDVGVYDQVYKISQFSIVALVTIFFNTVNPTLLNELENNYKNSKHLIRKYLKVFVIFGFPLIIYLSIFSKEIAFVLLGKEFRSSHIIMPFVFISAYLHGIANFYELRLKFINKLKKLSLIIIFSAIVNLLLTIAVVWLFGYLWAASTTALTYVILVCLFHFFDREIVKEDQKGLNYIVSAFLVISSQLGVYVLINTYFELFLIHKLVLLFIFISMYIIIFKNYIKNLISF